MGIIKKFLILNLLFVLSINAQLLELLQDVKLVELNSNPSLDISYTNVITLNFSNWLDAYGGTVLTANSIQCDADNVSGKYKESLLTISKTYFFRFYGTITAGTPSLRQTISGTTILSNFGMSVFTMGNNGLLIRTDNNNNGTLTVSELFASELKAPTGFTIPTLDATNYVIEDNGCKFVEATGTTYIETSSALKKGTRKFKVTQDWTQGRLSISNGTTSVNLNQSDGTQIVSLYFDGTQKMKVECTNNTISVISSLSIK